MIRKTVVGVALALAIFVAPPALLAQRAGAAQEDPELARDLDRIEEAMAPFHDVEAAVAAGYPRTAHCVESAAGGMGYHFIHPELLDDTLELERPEILVYMPAPGGGLELAGVEYAVPYSAWDRAEPPRILGRELKPDAGLQLWYLHVWIWQENPQGLFADWNPNVRCPK